jgi:hypothetical protein
MTQLDCTDIKALLSAIVDDQLDLEHRHQVERHLAGCKPCRQMLDEAEAVDALLALDVERTPRESLPIGFEDSVLARTMHHNRLRLRDRRWVTIGGWVASAAAIALAMTIWIVDRRALLRQSNVATGDGEPTPLVAYASNITNSWIYEGPVEPTRRPSGSSNETATVVRPADRSDASDSAVLSGAPVAIEQIMQAAVPTREDAETMFAAALALDQLRAADGRSFADVDVVRRIVEYDELLSRLAAAHSRLSAEDRAAVIAAESIFTRIVRGPISAQDLVEIGTMVQTLELPERLTRIGRRSDATMSL